MPRGPEVFICTDGGPPSPPETDCPRGWPDSPIHPGLRDGPCGYIGCCTQPGPAGAEHQARLTEGTDTP